MMYDEDEIDERDEAAAMADDSEASDGEPGLCNACSGSGEGQSEGSTCPFCKGKGEL